MDTDETTTCTIRCDHCGLTLSVTNPHVECTDNERRTLNETDPLAHWTLMSGGVHTRDYLACSGTCGKLIQESKTTEEMRRLGFHVGDYISFAWPRIGVVPWQLLHGWPQERRERPDTIANPRIYVSGPLRGAGESIGPNVHRAVRAGVELVEKGYVPFIPHLFALAQCIAPESEDFWMTLNRNWLRTCGAIIRLEGPSIGSDLEKVWAQQMGIPWWPSLESFISDAPGFVEEALPGDPELRP